MSNLPFLSDEWIAEAHRIRDEYAGRVPAAPSVRMNLVITAVPFGSGTFEGHISTASGQPELLAGHVGDPEVTVTTDYTTSRALLVEQDPTAAMQAFMGGKIRVQGDLTKLMALQAQQSGADPAAVELAREVAGRIRDMTA